MSVHRTQKKNPGDPYTKGSYGVRNHRRVTFGTREMLFRYETAQ